MTDLFHLSKVQYIDKYPITCAEYQHFAVTTRGLWHNPWEDEENSDDLPATNISLEDALAFAKWTGRHLPTPEEWVQAALSGCPDKSRPYPWGLEFRGGLCNTRESYYGRPRAVTWSEGMGGCSPAGVCDVVGNVAEWTIIKVDEGRYTGGLCGGSYREPAECCVVQRWTPAANDHKSSAVGFRCVASWEKISLQHSTETNKR